MNDRPLNTIYVETRQRPPFWIRVLVTGVFNLVGLMLAGWLGLIDYNDEFQVLLVGGLLLALINMVLRPVLMLLSLPFIIVTFGFFILVVSAFTLWLTAEIVPDLDLFGFWKTIGAVIVVSIANFALGGIFRDFTERPKTERIDFR
ncbi:MAG: phage holin family protein [Actinobacteria bacterium]|nr:phage holin family protein [Actinomycetota bacterium]